MYFADAGKTAYEKQQLMVPVGIKEPTGERPLCYCFGHSVASIKEELCAQGHSDALDDIRQKMQNPGCHCETSNPSGSCCLGDVAAGIQIARNELRLNNADSTMPDTQQPSRARGGERFSLAGTVISAIVASSCCWLPLVLLAAGLSGAGIAAALETLRPLFMVVTFGFLGAAFYLTYRPRRTSACGEEASCCDWRESQNGWGSSGREHRMSMRTLNKGMLWFVTAVAIAFVFFPNYIGALLGSGEASVTSTEKTQTVFQIEGMSCPGCAATVAQAIRGVLGVQSVDVRHERREALVGTKHSQPVPKDQILAALRRAGYEGRLIKSHSVGGSRRRSVHGSE